MTDHTPPTDQELDAIEAKAAELRERLDRKNPWPSDNESHWTAEGWKSGTRNALDKLHVEQLVAEVRRLRAELAPYEMLAPQQCPAGKHADWLVDSEYAHACPWCRIEELERITTPRTLRICACGHGHLAHAVPAPHGCFAFGQTCPCTAYRQLPHDEAVAQLKRNQKASAERAVPAVAETGEGGA